MFFVRDGHGSAQARVYATLVELRRNESPDVLINRAVPGSGVSWDTVVEMTEVGEHERVADVS